MDLSAELIDEILDFLDFQPLTQEPELPLYVDYHIVRDRHSSEFYCMQRHPRLVSAAVLIVQSDFCKVRM